jgi:hypothetical protein
MGKPGYVDFPKVSVIVVLQKQKQKGVKMIEKIIDKLAEKGFMTYAFILALVAIVLHYTMPFVKDFMNNRFKAYGGRNPKYCSRCRKNTMRIVRTKNHGSALAEYWQCSDCGLRREYLV